MELFEDFEYSTQDNRGTTQLTLFKYRGNSKKITVPSFIRGIKVEYMLGTFENRGDMEEIILPKHLLQVDKFCFRACKKLKRLHFPKTIHSLLGKSFQDCISLEEVLLPRKKDLKFSPLLFENCPKLYNEEGFLYFNQRLLGYFGKDSHIIIPDGVTTVEPYAFFGCASIKQVFLPDSVTSLGCGAFLDCVHLQQIRLPNNLTSLILTFKHCTSLEEIHLPPQLKDLGQGTFYGCSKLKRVEWGTSLTNIHPYAFYDCHSLEVLSFPEGLQCIDESFKNCTALKEITLPGTLENIMEQSFSNCISLEEVKHREDSQETLEKLTIEQDNFTYTTGMQQRVLTQNLSIPPKIFHSFPARDREEYLLQQLTRWDVISQKERDYFIHLWKKEEKATRKNTKPVGAVSQKEEFIPSTAKELVFLKSTAKEMGIYFQEGCHLDLLELEEYLNHSIEEENTAETAILLEYKHKTFTKEEIAQWTHHRELLELGLEAE